MNLVAVDVPGLQRPLLIRPGTTDEAALEEVFGEREYEMELAEPPRVIVDAGANVGMATAYFASRYPRARVIALEPDAENFAVLSLNVEALPSVTALRAALWSRDEDLAIVDPGLGCWGYQVCRVADVQGRRQIGDTKGYSLRTLLDIFAVTRIDLLKMDVEGSEAEILSDRSNPLSAVESLIVEVHHIETDGAAIKDALREFSLVHRGGLFLGRRNR